MLDNAKPLTDEKGGFTLIEIMAATGLLFIAVMAIAAIVVPLNRQREQVEEMSTVVSAAKSLVEEIKGSDPLFVETNYDGKTYSETEIPGLAGISGTYTGGDGLSVAVVRMGTAPDEAKLLEVTVTGSWNIHGHVETFELSTEIYNPNG